MIQQLPHTFRIRPLQGRPAANILVLRIRTGIQQKLRCLRPATQHSICRQGVALPGESHIRVGTFFDRTFHGFGVMRTETAFRA